MPPHHLPTKILYYERFSGIPFAPVAEVSIQMSEGVYELSATPSTDEYELCAPHALSRFAMIAPIKLKKGGTVSKRIYAFPHLARNMTTGEEIPLVAFSTPGPIFGPRVLKLNKTLHWVPPPHAETP